MANDINNGRSLAALFNELKDEIKDFLQTRVEMLKAELSEKMSAVKAAAPLAAIAIVFLGTAFLLFTLCLVALVSVAFYENPYRYFLAFLIVAVCWSLIGGACALLAKRELSERGLMPKKTIKVLKDDRVWLQNEARTQL